MGSFEDHIRENKNDFNDKLIHSVFRYQNKSGIEGLGDFKNAIIREIGGKMDKGGDKAFLSEDSWLKLFKTPEAKEILSDNLGEKKAEKIYKDIDEGKFEIHRTNGKPTEIAVTTIRVSMISSRGYIRRGKTIASYKRTKLTRFSDSQVRFLKALKPRLKQKKISNNQIITKFNNKYKNQQRTSSSIKTKIYRI